MLERPGLAKSLGFDVLECPLPYEAAADDLAAACRDAGVRFLMFNGAPGDGGAGEYGLSALPGREDDFKRAMDRSFHYAETLNVTFIHVLAGIIPGDTPREAAFETYAGNLDWVAAEARARGFQVLIEPINTFERAGYLLNRTDEAIAVIKAVGSDNIGIQYDFHNAQMMEGYVTHYLTEAFPHVRHVQIAGLPGRAPPDEGEQSLSYVFSLVERLGYDGHVGLEYRARNPREPGSTKASLAWMEQFGW